MARGQPIDINALDDDTLQVAREAAAAAGMSLEDWLARTLGDSGDNSGGGSAADSPGAAAGDDQWSIGPAGAGLDETVVVPGLGTGAAEATDMQAALAALAASVAPAIGDPRWTRRVDAIRAAVPAPPPRATPQAATPAPAATAAPPPVSPEPTPTAGDAGTPPLEPRLETPPAPPPAPEIGPDKPGLETPPPEDAAARPAPPALAPEPDDGGGELEKAIAAARERRRIAGETGQHPRRRAGGGFVVNLLIALLAIVSIALIGGLVYAWVSPDTTVDELASDVSREAGALYDVAATQVEDWLGLADDNAAGAGDGAADTADGTDDTAGGADGTDMATADDTAGGADGTDMATAGADGTDMAAAGAAGTTSDPGTADAMAVTGAGEAGTAGDGAADALPATGAEASGSEGATSGDAPTPGTPESDDAAATGEGPADTAPPAEGTADAAGPASAVDAAGAETPATDAVGADVAAADAAGAEGPEPGEVPSGEPAVITELRDRAESGDAAAQRVLGERYLEGEGVAQDDATAVRWLERAAETGDPEAQYMLGRLYESGTGVPENQLLAMAFYLRASEQGMPRAALRLGEVYRDGALNWRQSYADAATQFRIAADAEVGAAEHELAELYAAGNGVDESPLLAHLWFTRAAAHGSPGSAARAEDMAALLTPEQLARSAAMIDAPPETGTTLYGVTAAEDTLSPDAVTIPEPPQLPETAGAAADVGDPAGTATGNGAAPIEAVEPPREVATIPVNPPTLVDGPSTAGTGAAADGFVAEPDLAATASLAPQAIAEIQSLLNQLDYAAGPADGIPGRRTTAAIRAYQLAEGLLPADGLPSLSLLVRLRDSTLARGQ